MPPINFLAISGGGDNGAFAAGVLAGLTASGKRPVFRVVTGISAGALISMPTVASGLFLRDGSYGAGRCNAA